MIYLPDKCLRKECENKCEPIAQIHSDEEPISFICIGKNDGSTRVTEQDFLTKCVKSLEDGERSHVDKEEDCDVRDLIDEISVIAQALSVLSNIGEITPK